MSNIVSFPNRPTPHHLEQLLRRGQWEELAQALRSGPSPTLPIRGYPLFAAVLQSLQHHRVGSGYQAPDVPLNLKKALLEMPTPTGAISEDQQGRQQTAVWWACWYGQLDVALDLVNKGYQVDTPDRTIWDAFLEGLFSRGPMVERTIHTRYGDALHIVSLDPMELERCRFWMLSPLVAAVKNKCSKWPGINTSPHDNHCLSSLIVAGHGPLLHAFLNQGVHPDCDLYFQDDDGNIQPSPSRASEVAIEMQQEDILRLLMDYGAQWERSVERQSLLDIAAMSGGLPCLDYLIRHAPIKQLAQELPGAMMHAVAAGRIPVAEHLINTGAPLFIQTTSGYTLLHQAAASGQLEMLEWLQDKGMDVHVEAVDGTTPMSLLKQIHPHLYAQWSQQQGCRDDSNIIEFRPRAAR